MESARLCRGIQNQEQLPFIVSFRLETFFFARPASSALPVGSPSKPKRRRVRPFWKIAPIPAQLYLIPALFLDGEFMPATSPTLRILGHGLKEKGVFLQDQADPVLI
jgi:hypothetical protein